MKREQHHNNTDIYYKNENRKRNSTLKERASGRGGEGRGEGGRDGGGEREIACARRQ